MCITCSTQEEREKGGGREKEGRRNGGRRNGGRRNGGRRKGGRREGERRKEVEGREKGRRRREKGERREGEGREKGGREREREKSVPAYRNQKLTLSKISLISPVSSELGSMMFIANLLFPMSRSGMDSAPVRVKEHR